MRVNDFLTNHHKRREEGREDRKEGEGGCSLKSVQSVAMIIKITHIHPSGDDVVCRLDLKHAVDWTCSIYSP